MLILQHQEEEDAPGEESLKMQRKRKNRKMFVPSAPRANRVELTPTLSGTNQLVLHDVRFGVDRELKAKYEGNENAGLTSRAMAVHVRFRSLFISLPSSEQEQRKMTQGAVTQADF